MMKKLRVGIVGFGFIGPQHMEAIRRLGYAEVTALAVTRAERARALAGQHFVEKGYGDWRELVADPEIDVVDITTPTAFHAPIAIAAARAGKHVIVDKPMCLTSMEAREMLEAAESAGVVHAVTFNIAYNIMVRQAQAMVRAGKIGAIHFVRGHYLQEWLLRETDYNWRLDPQLAGNKWHEMWLERLENMPFLISTWLRHQHRDDYWKHGSVCEDYSAIKAAILSIGGWHDGYRNTISHLVSNLDAPVKGIVGPWNHKYPHYAGPKPAIGFLQEAKRWWDKWLKNEQTGIENDPAMRLWLMDSLKPKRWFEERPGRWPRKPTCADKRLPHGGSADTR